METATSPQSFLHQKDTERHPQVFCGSEGGQGGLGHPEESDTEERGLGMTLMDMVSRGHGRDSRHLSLDAERKDTAGQVT